jgi:hypothetical protein
MASLPGDGGGRDAIPGGGASGGRLLRTVRAAPGKLLFRIALDGKSKQSLEAYGLDSAMERLERLVEGELGRYYLRRRG